MNQKPRVIELFEYETRELKPQELPLKAAQVILDCYRGKISIEPVSFLHPEAGWRVCSEGLVGYIPLTEDLGLRLCPKKGVTISNIFRMLEYAYDLKSFHLLEGLIDCQFTEELYERLAAILADRVLQRGKKGFYRYYQPEYDRLSCVRGRIDLKKACSAPWNAMPFCHFEEHTADVQENRILAWTLSQISRSGICTDRTLPAVRQAYRRLAQSAEIRPCLPGDCVGRVYSRLNQDYEPMHALCHLFLECRGPGHEAGERKMIPFLVNMASLYERFVARWLEKNLPDDIFLVQCQEQVQIDPNLGIDFRIDLTVFDIRSQSWAAVMDTKYKVQRPTPADIEQVAAYAGAKGCGQAILVYPECCGTQLNGRVGDISVKSATFSLDEDPDTAGRRFVKDALGFEIE